MNDLRTGMRTVAAMALLAATGCQYSFSVSAAAELQCQASSECPEGLICVVDVGRCRPPGQPCVAEAADGYRAVPDGNHCATAEVAEHGICLHGVCLLSTCGDGVIDAELGEVCDDAAENSDLLPQACRSTCMPAHCGDGVVDANEQCDDGNQDDHDLCLSTCEENRCGDGIVSDTPVAGQAQEQCDDGNTTDEDDCLSSCRLNVCGDGVLKASAVDAQTPEECDDGAMGPDGTIVPNPNPNDGCHQCRHVSWQPSLVLGTGLLLADPTRVGFNIVGVAAGRDGSVLFTHERDDIQGEVFHVDAAGTLRRFAGATSGGTVWENMPALSAWLRGATQLAVAGNGDVYVITKTGGVASAVRRVRQATGLIDTAAGGLRPCLATHTNDECGSVGAARSIGLGQPAAIHVTGREQLYIADRGANRVWQVDLAAGLGWVIAGKEGGGFSGDGGYGTYADLLAPSGVVADSADYFGRANVYIADTGNRRIRRVDAVSGSIETLAGSDTQCVPADAPCGDGGAAAAATFDSPAALALDGDGGLLVADLGTHRVRRIDLDSADKTITTIAGVGGAGLSADGTAASAAHLSSPTALAFDSRGRLLIAERDNHRLRRVEADGRLATVAGDGSAGLFLDGGPATSTAVGAANGVYVDADHNLYVADEARIWRVDAADGTIASFVGTGVCGFAGDAGPAAAAQVCRPHGMCMDAAGNLFFADRDNHRLRRVDTSGTITTVAGDGTPANDGDGLTPAGAQLQSPVDVACHAGDLYIASGPRVRRIHGSLISTIAGGGAADPATEPLATAADLGTTTSVAFDALGNLLIASGGYVYRVLIQSGILSIYAGNGAATFSGSIGDGGAATSASFQASGIALDSHGDLFIADQGTYRLRRVDAATGVITTVAGDSTFIDMGGGFGVWWSGFSGDGGPAGQALLGSINDVAIDQQDRLYVATTPGNDNRGAVRRIDAQLTITTVVGGVLARENGRFERAALDAPSVLLDLSRGGPTYLLAADHTGIRAVDFAAGELRSVYGYCEWGYMVRNTTDWQPALYAGPAPDVHGMAYDPMGQMLYGAWFYGATNTLFRIDTSPSVWLAEDLPTGGLGLGDGPLATARFDDMQGFAVDAVGRWLYIADSGNHAIRRVALDDPDLEVTTIAGVPGQVGFYEGDAVGQGVLATQALFNSPRAVAVAPDGGLYIADTGNHRVRRLYPDGKVVTLLGDGIGGSSGQGQPAALFEVDTPSGLAVDAFGNLFIASRTAVRLVTAGASGLVDGNSAVLSIYGATPRQSFPEPYTVCLTGIAVVDSDGAGSQNCVYVADACRGYLVELRRAP